MNEDTRSAYGGDAVKAGIIASALPGFRSFSIIWATTISMGVALTASDCGATFAQSCAIGFAVVANYVFGFMDARRYVLDAAIRAAEGPK